MKKQTVVDKLRDLHRQATEERSHYYTGKVILEAIDEINRLYAALSHTMDSVTDDEECSECKEIRKILGWS
jgi:hypothetical protein